MKQRLEKLQPLPRNTPAYKMHTVSNYAALLGVGVNSVYNKISFVVSGKSQWTKFIAYRKDRNIVIVSITTTTSKPKNHAKAKLKTRVRLR